MAFIGLRTFKNLWHRAEPVSARCSIGTLLKSGILLAWCLCCCILPVSRKVGNALQREAELYHNFKHFKNMKDVHAANHEICCAQKKGHHNCRLAIVKIWWFPKIGVQSSSISMGFHLPKTIHCSYWGTRNPHGELESPSHVTLGMTGPLLQVDFMEPTLHSRS